VDSTIVQRAILNRLDSETCLQWLAHESPKRPSVDLLLLTTEESYVVDRCLEGPCGFISVSRSIDDICEESDNIDNQVEQITGSNTYEMKYIRTQLKCRGFVGKCIYVRLSICIYIYIGP
jgi:hypothetical protein